MDLLSQIDFEPPAPPNTTFVGAAADSNYHGVLNENGKSCNTPHNPFVDDTLMADIRRHILTAIAASVEALFIMFGRDSPYRRSFLSIDKFLRARCSYVKDQLGLTINTRSMEVSLPQDKLDRLRKVLNSTWHPAR